MLLHDYLRAAALRLPHKVALVSLGVRHTYGDIDRATAGLAATFRARGVLPGDRVAVFLPNGVEFVVTAFAALRAGAVFLPINHQTKADKVRYILEDARATAVVTHVSLAPAWRKALDGVASIKAVVVAGDLGAAERDRRNVVRFDEAAAADPPRASDAGTIDLDLAAIIYTSGSTGEPKGVMLTHLNMTSAADSITQYLGLRQDDVIMCALPLSFDYGLYQVLMAFKVGARAIIEPSFAFPAKVIEVMRREQVTFFPGVPTMFALLLGHDGAPGCSLPELRCITNTAAALSETQVRRLRGLFPHAQLFSMYGLTECKRVSFLPPSEVDRRPTSVGRGMPNEEVYLVDDQGTRLPNGSVGELFVRGSNVMRGYWEKPTETAQRLRPGRYPGEVVLATGDIFRTDDEGYLYFVGRKDDIIKSRGEKVSPREVENAIFALPGVNDCAVVGVDDPILGQAVKAYVVLDPGAECTEKEVVRHCLASLEGHMVPKHVEFVPALPTTATGKVSRAQLRESV